MIHIDPRNGIPIYRQVMEQIRLQITAGQLAPGDQLESVSSLSARLKVNPMTISKAFGFLVEEGVVERRKGVGIFVAEVDREAAESRRLKVLSDALHHAAGLAVQLNVPVARAVDILRQHMNDFAKKKNKGDKS
jgi:GntR family transcriptional regulator